MNERWKPSVTVAAIAARRRADGQPEYLLVEEETAAGLRLNNPAGHLDPGESPQQAVVREALEETARVFTPEAFVGVYLTRNDAIVGSGRRDLPAPGLRRHGRRARPGSRASTTASSARSG